MKDAAKPTVAIAVVIGMSIVTVAVATRDKLAGQTVFGLSGELVTGLLFGLAIGIILLGILQARKAG
jgi:hypothetical protein